MLNDVYKILRDKFSKEVCHGEKIKVLLTDDSVIVKLQTCNNDAANKVLENLHSTYSMYDVSLAESTLTIKECNHEIHSID